MEGTDARSIQLYCDWPLREAPRRYADMRLSPYRMRYLQTLLEHCPRGGAALETGIGTGFDSDYLSLRGVNAFGIDIVPQIPERANQIAAMLGAPARFSVGDLFEVYKEGS